MAESTLRKPAYTCPPSQVFAFSATCTNFVRWDNYLRHRPPAILIPGWGLPVSPVRGAWGISQQKGAIRTMTPATRGRTRGSSHSFTLRTALRTNGPRATRLPKRGLPVSTEYRAPESTASRAREISRAWGIGRISNRHPCRLETRLNPCAPTKSHLLIVTQSPLFSAQIPTTIKRISNRNIPLLDTSLSSSKQRTSFFLIATDRQNGASQCRRQTGLPSRRRVELGRSVEPGGINGASQVAR